MPLILLAVLALVQGLTELLPISSSAHQILTWEVFARLEQPTDFGGEQELMFDIAGHVGTLAAIVVYFWRDVLAIVMGAVRLVTGRADRRSRLFLLIVLSAIPAAVAGYLLQDYADNLRMVELIAWTQIGFGLLLYVADHVGMTIRKIEHLRVPDVIVLGLAQALALIPGTSRSGITMTAGRFLGMERSEAARFSFLMAMPAIAGAGLLAGLDFLRLEGASAAALTTDALIIVGLSFLTSLAAVAFLMAWIRRQSFTIFVVYRVLLGIFLLWLVYSGTLEGLHF